MRPREPKELSASPARNVADLAGAALAVEPSPAPAQAKTPPEVSTKIVYDREAGSTPGRRGATSTTRRTAPHEDHLRMCVTARHCVAGGGHVSFNIDDGIPAGGGSDGPMFTGDTQVGVASTSDRQATTV
ncbi:hypothetical protein ACWDKQ_06125 [Saccharopolyspora sp. NPDC000995]